MSILTQKTLANKICLEGIGIHTGKKVNLKILPSAPNTGIVFKRTDLNFNNIVYPNYSNVVDILFVQQFQMSMVSKYQRLNI